MIDGAPRVRLASQFGSAAILFGWCPQDRAGATLPSHSCPSQEYSSEELVQRCQAKVTAFSDGIQFPFAARPPGPRNNSKQRTTTSPTVHKQCASQLHLRRETLFKTIDCLAVRRYQGKPWEHEPYGRSSCRLHDAAYRLD